MTGPRAQAVLTCCRAHALHGHKGCTWPTGSNPSPACHHRCAACRPDTAGQARP